MDYSRQSSLVDASRVPRVRIVGCGGIGSWIAFFLVLAGLREIDLYDEGLVESSNLARTPYRPSDVGRMKAEALAEILSLYRPSALILYHGHWIAGTSHGYPFEAIVGAVDGLEVRRVLLADAKRVGATYWDVGAEALGYNISGSPADWEIPSERTAVDGYFTPIFVGPVAMCAAQTAWMILRKQKPTEIRVDESKTPFYSSAVRTPTPVWTPAVVTRGPLRAEPIVEGLGRVETYDPGLPRTWDSVPSISDVPFPPTQRIEEEDEEEEESEDFEPDPDFDTDDGPCQCSECTREEE